MVLLHRGPMEIVTIVSVEALQDMTRLIPKSIDRDTFEQTTFGYAFKKAFGLNQINKDFKEHRQIFAATLAVTSNKKDFYHFFHSSLVSTLKEKNVTNDKWTKLNISQFSTIMTRKMICQIVFGSEL